MRKLLGSAVLVALGAGGCVIVEDDCAYYDDCGYYEEVPALITAQWQFANIATDQVTGCPAGFDTVGVHSQPVDLEGRPIGRPVLDLFDCADGIGTTAPLYPDVYETWIDVTSFDRTRLYAESPSATLDIIDFDATFEAEILNDGGYFTLSWDLVGAMSNQTLACDVVGAQKIQLSTTSSRSMETDQFACGDGFGVTAGFLQGDYTVQISATSGETVINETPVILDGKTILDRNRITDLGTVSIPIGNR